MTLTLTGSLPYVDYGDGLGSTEWVLLASSTISSSVAQHDIDMSSYIASWDRIKVAYTDVTVVTDDVPLYLDPSVDGGSTFLGGSDLGGTIGYSGASDGSPGIYAVTNPFWVELVRGSGVGNAAGETASGDIIMTGHNDTSTYTLFRVFAANIDGSGAVRLTHACTNLTDTGTPDYWRIKTSSGNIDGGVFTVYGSNQV